jgi:Zn-dependent protease with chaperone function
VNSGRYYVDVARQSDRLFYALLGASLIPVGAMVFALARAAHDVRAALADAPAPVTGLCRQAVIYTVDPFAHVAYVAFGAAALVALTLGTIAGIATHLRTRRVLREHRAVVAVPERLLRLAGAASIRRIRLIASPRPLAFTFGYLSPGVAVSDSLLRSLDDSELEAVLLHEAEHVRTRDPLRVLVVAAISRAFLFAPLLGRLAESFSVAKEIDADRAVIQAMGNRHALVSALLAAGTYDSEGATAGFADALSARIASLEGEEPVSAGAGWRAFVATWLSLVVIAAGLFVIATGAVDAHALHICA